MPSIGIRAGRNRIKTGSRSLPSEVQRQSFAHCLADPVPGKQHLLQVGKLDLALTHTNDLGYHCSFGEPM